MHHQLLLLLALAIIIVASKIAGHLVRRYLHQPVVFGEILVGLLLGPTAINLFGWPIFHGSADWLLDSINTLGFLGVLLLMFIAGLETDLQQMRRVGKVAFGAATLGVLLPLGVGELTARLFGLPLYGAIFVGAVLTATSVSISAQTLMEINQLRTKEGATILGAAVIDDILGIIVLSFVIAFGAGRADMQAGLAHTLGNRLAQSLGMPGAAALLQIVLTLLLMGSFFVLAFLFGARWFPRMLAWVERLHASYVIPSTALVVMLLFAFGAEYFGQVAAITGAYLVGLFFARTDYARQVEHAIHPFTYALFVPVFLMSIGLSANMRLLAREQWLFAALITLVAIVTKIVGCGFGARVTGFSTRESLRVGVGMISRGEVGLIVAQVGLSYAVISQQIYAALILMILVTTVATPVLLRLSFPHSATVEADLYESVAFIEREDREKAND